MLELKHISKAYRKRKALQDVSFSLSPGRIYGLVGANGSGKTTLLKALTGLIRFDGQINKDGEPFLLGKKGMKVGYMIEEPSFYGELSGRDNLELIANLYPRFDKHNLDWALQKVGLLSRAEERYKTYSLGMKQRLYFAFAIMDKPDFLFLDEPFNGVDPLTVEVFEDIMRDFVKTGATILVSSHGVRELQALADGAFILDDGKIAFESQELVDVDLLKEFLDIAHQHGDELL